MPASDRDEALKELGRLARSRREEAHLSLEDVFEKTRVRIGFLRGIEQGDYDGFPDLVYIRGFVRTYLGIIGADDLQDEFLSWLSRDVSRERDRQTPPQNILGNGTSPTKGFKPVSHFWLFALLILVLIGAGVYVWYSWADRSFLSVEMRNGQSGDPQPGSIASDDSASADLFMLASGDEAALSILPASANILPEPKPAPEPIKPRLHIRARGDVWMKVTVGENVLFSKTLKSGSDVSWDLPSPARVTFGRPNMAEITLNGKNLGTANPRGSKKAETYLYNPDGTHRQL